MKKALTSALVIAFLMSSAAAEPIQMTDRELERIHAGEGTSPFQFTLLYRHDGSAVLIQNGVEYKIKDNNLSLPDGTQVQIMQNGNLSTILVTNTGANISERVTFIGGANITSSISR